MEYSKNNFFKCLILENYVACHFVYGKPAKIKNKVIFCIKGVKFNFENYKLNIVEHDHNNIV